MKNTRIFNFSYLGVLLICIMACNKTEFLNSKPSSSILTPNTLSDFQGLLDNPDVNNVSAALPTLSSDEYNYISYPVYLTARTATERNAYIWARDIFNGETAGGDWSIPYQSIFYANNVLMGIEEIASRERDKSTLNYIKGWALFLRGYGYYELASNFCVAYREQTANTDLGVPLRLKPSIDEILPRSTVRQTYDQIISDLNTAIPLLSSELPQANRNRPSKIAAYALLARIYLSMRKYDLAEEQAQLALQLYDKLIDYNTISTTSSQPFSTTTDEMIFHKRLPISYPSLSVFSNQFITINPTIRDRYEVNDLRPSVYFTIQPSGGYVMKRMYGGAANGLYAFSGLAVDEVYLIIAECAARRNDISTAMLYLNNLLIKRFRTNNFIPVTASSSSDAINKIINERIKELIFRGLRWSDLKRLNIEGENITLARQLDGVTYILPPNDPRYVFPIPDNEILYSGIQQNIR